MDHLPSTISLLDRIRGGDRDALDELLRRYQETILKIVRSRLGQDLRRKVESSDIVQEVMTSAFKGLWKQQSFDYSREGAFRRYITTIVEHRIRDERDRWNAKKRNLARERPLGNAGDSDSSDAPDVLADDGTSPSSKAARAEEEAILERALEKLGRKSTQHRRLIESVHLYGRSLEEISEKAGKSVDAVRMQLTRAVKALQKIVQHLPENG
jgi:RNA polymerase sigma-70 factor (ECF subfamily)